MKRVFILGLLLLLLSTLIACENKEANVEQATELAAEPILHLHISQRIDQNYKMLKKIEEPETVKNLLDILTNTPYIDAKVTMSRHPDYKIKVVSVESAVKDESTVYWIWVIPDKNVVEVVIEDQHKYGKVPEENTKIILEILGEK